MPASRAPGRSGRDASSRARPGTLRGRPGARPERRERPPARRGADAERRDDGPPRGGGTPRARLLNVIVHGAAYVGACVVARTAVCGGAPAPLGESSFGLRSTPVRPTSRSFTGGSSRWPTTGLQRPPPESGCPRRLHTRRPVPRARRGAVHGRRGACRASFPPTPVRGRCRGSRSPRTTCCTSTSARTSPSCATSGRTSRRPTGSRRSRSGGWISRPRRRATRAPRRRLARRTPPLLARRERLREERRSYACDTFPTRSSARRPSHPGHHLRSRRAARARDAVVGRVS